jgi:hypothetical protein
MNIWIAVHPFRWLVWPFYGNEGVYPRIQKYVGLGPISVHWTPESKK